VPLRLKPAPLGAVSAAGIISRRKHPASPVNHTSLFPLLYNNFIVECEVANRIDLDQCDQSVSAFRPIIELREGSMILRYQVLRVLLVAILACGLLPARSSLSKAPNWSARTS
jgi:hypothetical protein